MEITSSYHLPTNAYWHCSDKYNGLSQLARFGTTFPIGLIRSKQLGNTKISSTVIKQLNN